MLAKIIFYIIVLSFPANVCFSQQSKQDSLIRIAQNSSSDLEKSDLYLQIARLNGKTNKTLAINYYNKALELDTNRYSNACLLDTLGLYNWHLGNFEEALHYYGRSLQIFEEYMDSVWIGKLNNNIAVANWGMGNIYEALNHYQAALDIRKEINDFLGVSRVLNNIGLIYQDWELFDEALEWHKEAQDYALKAESFDAIAYSYSSIALCYENKKDYKTALDYFNLGYENDLKKKKANFSESYFLANIGRVYFKMGVPDSAILYFNRSLEYATLMHNKNRIAVAQYFLGKTYLGLNQLKLAESFILKSFDVATENNYTGLVKDNLFNLSEIEEKKGNTTTALDYYKRASHLKDSTFNKGEIARFTDLQIRYNIEKNEQENELLKANNEIQQIKIKQQKNITILLIFLGILGFSALFYITRSRNKTKKLNRKLEQSERELIQANADKDKFFTIIAHDLRSPLNGLLGITDIIETDYDQLDSEYLKKLVFMLGKSAKILNSLLEGLLQWAQAQSGRTVYHHENIDLYECATKALESIKTNATTKRIALENNIQEGTIVFADKNSLETILRNLSSNGIKYTNEGGVVCINSEIKDTEIIISVKDNGVGIPKEMVDKLFTISEKHSTKGTHQEIGTGLGLILCSELAKNNKGSIWFESKEGEGSTFYLSLPKAK